MASRHGMQAVFQDPYSSLNPRKRVGWLLEEPLRVQGLGGDRRSRAAEVDAMLVKVGLDPGYKDRYPMELSGGQRQRIAIGMGLITRPRLLIADEPVSSLDVSVQAQILNLMKDLQEEYGFSCLFISHNLRVIRFMCDRVAVMQSGRIIETAPAEQLFRAPEQPYTRSFIEASMLV
jgi:ABC-type microcin C transport system duplicated ATPase subunit YejF